MRGSGSKLDLFKRTLDTEAPRLDKSLYGSQRKHQSDPGGSSRAAAAQAIEQTLNIDGGILIYSPFCVSFPKRARFCPEFSASRTLALKERARESLQ